MIELKRICPFCGGEMIGTNGHPICHYNPDCIIHDESVPQELLDLLTDTKKKLDDLSDKNGKLETELDRTRKALGDTIKLAEEMLKDIEYEGLCSWQYKERLNKIKSITKGE